MERYSDYKDSGVKWLGEIPSHWEVCRFKNMMSLVTTPSNDSNKIGLENIESGSGKFIQTENEFEGNGVHFQVNDVVYGKLRPYLQKVWLATFSGNAVGDFFVFRMNNKVVGKYLQYLMLSRCFTDDVNASTYGAKMPRVSSEYILTMRCAVPSKDEQIKMVSYLDTATAKIDAAIAQQQKMIDLLNERKQIIINRAVTKGLNPNAKMKDSGVEWIGEVPEHWEVRSFKTMMAIQRGHDLTAEEFKMGEIPVYGSGGLMGFHNVVTSKGPCIVIGRSGSVGKLQYIEEDFWAHNTAIYLTDNKGNDIKYLYYLLKSVDLSALATQTAVPTLDRKNVLSYKVPCCLDKIEQEEISHYLDVVLSKIDQMISTVNGKISLLQERKQIIINEVVTGKVRVV